MRDLKELGALLIGFIPWLLFLLLSGHSLTSLESAIIVSLVASLTFGFDDLKRGYILTWGTLLFFCFCAIFVNLLSVLWVATYMDLLSNAVLSSIMWLTILVRKPFALQYARRDVPREQWNDPQFIQGCRFITLVWASLMSVAAGLSILRRSSTVNLPGWVYFDASLCIIVTGLTVTTLFKRKKRLQREKEEARNRGAS
jgi:hypothetical protein